MPKSTIFWSLCAPVPKKILMATVMVTGNATFADGQREMRVPIKDGAAKVPVVAKGSGRVSGPGDGISNATQEERV